MAVCPLFSLLLEIVCFDFFFLLVLFIVLFFFLVFCDVSHRRDSVDQSGLWGIAE